MTLRNDALQRVHTIVARQDGVTTASQLHEAGIGRGTIRGMVRSGTWTRLSKGAYWVRPHPRGPSLRAQVRAVLLTAGPHLVAAGPSAAHLLGIEGLPHDDTLHFAAPPAHEIESILTPLRQALRLPRSRRV